MKPIRLAKTIGKCFDRPVDRSVELHFDVCFQQTTYRGVGVWLGYTGRGLQKIAVIGKTKIVYHQGHEGTQRK